MRKGGVGNMPQIKRDFESPMENVATWLREQTVDSMAKSPEKEIPQNAQKYQAKCRREITKIYV